jgi:hypothetical protein
MLACLGEYGDRCQRPQFHLISAIEKTSNEQGNGEELRSWTALSFACRSFYMMDPKREQNGNADGKLAGEVAKQET